ncbi:efflux RND transporter periplasmic adaptor subunit [Microbulbifer sp. OS29]|uniref:Efflux RND transporter periplasmic adaptor subunit n=1 Tax=Microbulbifer okhotskensis TaxID=2926617 RepID=A0A9X2ELB8_9GAMM|nr:efflux RND transporter periplasmic adaptor subunit [Microbulbifer okhotskensis]MCO1334357.1 efflux RND transporter periplasmic adaptor subunit [Microbulbifer okhotskensis]
MSKLTKAIRLAILSLSLLLSGIWLVPLGYASADHGDSHDAHEAGGEHEDEHGPNGGRILEEGELAVELLIYESGVQPEFRAWITRDGKPLDNVRLSVELERLGGKVDQVSFTWEPRTRYYRGEGIVGEPHSFDVTVSVFYNGERAEWTFESHEGRVQITEQMAEKAGIKTAVAGPGTIKENVTLYGKTAIDHRSISHVRARYPGTVVTIEKALGDLVEKGDKLASIESNDSLQTYSLVAPISGQIIDKQTSRGEFSGERVLFTIANYNQLWAELQVFPTRRGQINRGQKVSIIAGDRTFDSTITSLAPGGNGQPFAIARAVIENPNDLWTTDLMVQGQVVTNENPVPLVVENRALQPFRDWTVVFIKVGEAYEIRPLKLGRSDGAVTEVLSGLNVGDRYVTENSYLIKADIEKSGAAHSH